MSEQKKIMIIQKFPLELKNMVTQIIEEGFVVDVLAHFSGDAHQRVDTSILQII